MQDLSQTRLGEVIEASTTAFNAQCYELYSLPPLGTLVKTCEGDNELYAVVHRAFTEGIEPGRKPIARGKDEISEEAVFQANPQLSKLLRSEFSALVVGYKNAEHLHQYLPPHPARIHGFVYACNQKEILNFSRSCDFLTLLLNAKMETPSDELVAAVLRLMSASQEDTRAFLIKAGKELASLLGQDYARLKAILERIRP
ncbi:MAG: hypothetical protein FWC25_02515 [Dehalococcoidia bacterium]|jgi:hypothetical protein|nr:hypothetical protein [Dehalococcoidia bacterium]